TGLSGDDIVKLVSNPSLYNITDTIANVTYKSGGPGGLLAYYGELASHFPYAPLGGKWGNDIFHTAEAKAHCGLAMNEETHYTQAMFAEALNSGTTTGGSTNQYSDVKNVYIGKITGVVTTGGDTNPELFVSGGGNGRSTLKVQQQYRTNEIDANGVVGAAIPRMLVIVNGSRAAAVAWTMHDDGADYSGYDGTEYKTLDIGHRLTTATGWNLSDMYFVNNWPGSPLTQHKADKTDFNNLYVTQVNYVTGYVCEASLQ
ncbi:hypothetical protein WAF85_004881, partial [Salmonella enterica]